MSGKKSKECPKLALPKPNSKKDREKKISDRTASRRTFRSKVFELDEYNCRNPICRSRFVAGPSGLDPHHIKYVSDGGSDDPSNGITACSLCHDDYHNGRKVDGVWMSGRSYMLYVLCKIATICPHNFRWWGAMVGLMKKVKT